MNSCKGFRERRVRFVVAGLFWLFCLVTPANAFYQFLVNPTTINIAGRIGAAVIARSATGATLGELGGACGVSCWAGLAGIASLLVGDTYEVPVQGAQIPLNQTGVSAYTVGGFHGASGCEAGGAYTNYLNGYPPNTAGPSICKTNPTVYYVYHLTACSNSSITLHDDACPPVTPAGDATIPVTGTTITETRTTSDGRLDVKVSGSGYLPDTSDPDWTGPSQAPFSGGAGPIQIGTYDVNGNPVSITVDNVSGNTRVQVTTQTTDANGNTQVVTLTGTIDPSGNAQPLTQQTIPQASVDPTTGKVTQMGTPANQNQNPDSGLSNHVIVDNMPSDYARDATTQLANTKLEQIHTDLTATVTAPVDPESHTSQEISDQFFSSTFTGLLAWQLPARSVSCPTASFTVWSRSYTIDAHCTLFSSQAAVISATMLLVWTIAALFIVLSA